MVLLPTEESRFPDCKWATFAYHWLFVLSQSWIYSLAGQSHYVTEPNISLKNLR